MSGCLASQGMPAPESSSKLKGLASWLALSVPLVLLGSIGRVMWISGATGECGSSLHLTKQGFADHTIIAMPNANHGVRCRTARHDL